MMHLGRMASYLADLPCQLCSPAIWGHGQPKGSKAAKTATAPKVNKVVKAAAMLTSFATVKTSRQKRTTTRLVRLIATRKSKETL